MARRTFPHESVRPATLRGWPLVAAAIALTAVGYAPAQERIYKSIDANGNVTYSSTPPDSANVQRIETVKVEPGPGPAERANAEQRMQRIESIANQRTAQSASRTSARSSSVQAAEQALNEARENLAKAKERGAGDWQTIATGGRVPSASYLQRVQKAQQRVQAAEDALRAAQLGGR